MAERVALFIDAHNVYKGARRAFHRQSARGVAGQVWPGRVGEIIWGRAHAGACQGLSRSRVRGRRRGWACGSAAADRSLEATSESPGV